MMLLEDKSSGLGEARATGARHQFSKLASVLSRGASALVECDDLAVDFGFIRKSLDGIESYLLSYPTAVDHKRVSGHE